MILPDSTRFLVRMDGLYYDEAESDSCADNDRFGHAHICVSCIQLRDTMIPLVTISILLILTLLGKRGGGIISE